MEAYIRNITRGRKKRTRSGRAGSAVKIGGHTRSPRGPNSRKKAVRVDGYKRGRSSKKKRK